MSETETNEKEIYIQRLEYLESLVPEIDNQLKTVSMGATLADIQKAAKNLQFAREDIGKLKVKLFAYNMSKDQFIVDALFEHMRLCLDVTCNIILSLQEPGYSPGPDPRILH